MKNIIEEFVKGMYDSLSNVQKMHVSYAQFSETISILLFNILKKMGMVALALIITIPFLVKFHISNGVRYWFFELFLWIVWIKESIDWKEYKNLKKKLEETK